MVRDGRRDLRTHPSCLDLPGTFGVALDKHRIALERRSDVSRSCRGVCGGCAEQDQQTQYRQQSEET